VYEFMVISTHMWGGNVAYKSVQSCDMLSGNIRTSLANLFSKINEVVPDYVLKHKITTTCVRHRLWAFEIQTLFLIEDLASDIFLYVVFI
jgi:hypothetical protein